MADDKDKGQLNSAKSVLEIVQTIEQNGIKRALDRALINSQFNGGRPYSDKEVEENQIQVNVNTLEGFRVAQDANLQVDGALLNKDRFFVARCLKGPPEKRDEWGEIFTAAIHRPLKRGRSGKKHMNVLKNRNRSLVLHGIGGMAWMNSYDWMPKFIALEDCLIPTDATVDMSDDLGHFAINGYFTPYQLYKMTHGDAVDKGWNVPLAEKICTSLDKARVQGFTPDILDRPEEFESLMKQKSAFMNSDAVPKVKVSFFFSQDEKDGQWYRKVLFRKTEGIGVADADTDEFLYKSDQPFAEHIEEIIHFQFGDGNVVAPLKFHSVRGLGVLLFAIVELSNRMYCQTQQHTMEQLMALLRITNPTDKDRPKVIMLNPYGVLEDGVSFVPPEERNRADPNMVEFGMAQNRQIISQNSASYVQDVDTGTQKEQTLGEAQIKLQSANKIVSGMLSSMYVQELFYYEELKRRFLNKNSTNEDVVKFQKECVTKGIPKELLTPDNWEVDVEKVFGMGDQTLAIQEVTALMGMYDKLDPSAQRIVLRKYIATITRNPDLAARLVPENPDEASAGRQEAEDVFATLMRGIPVSFREGIEQQDYVVAMVEMMAQEIGRIQNTDNMGTPQDVLGLETVANDVTQHIEFIAQDPGQKELVTGLNKVIGKMMNDVKAFAQRQEEAAKANMQDPEELAKIQMEQMKTQSKIANQEQTTQAKLAMQEEKHQQQLAQNEERHRQQLAQQRAQTMTQIDSEQARTASAIESEEEKTEAQIEMAKAKAAATAGATKGKTNGGGGGEGGSSGAQAINLTLTMPKAGKTTVKLNRDAGGRITSATKEES